MSALGPGGESAAPANAVGALTHSKPLSVGGNNVRAVNFRFDSALSAALAQRRTTPARQTTTPTNEITAPRTATANTNHFRELIERVIFDCAPNYKPQRIASAQSFVFGCQCAQPYRKFSRFSRHVQTSKLIWGRERLGE